MLIKRIRGLFAWAVIGLLIGLGVAALAGKAHAATTTQVTINSTTFTDLGAAPVMVQSLNYPVQIVVSDSLPSPSATNVGYALYNGQPVTIPAADSSSHVYAAMIGGNATTLVVTAVEAGGGAANAVTQGTIPWAGSLPDPCEGATKSSAPINVTSPGTVQLVAISGSTAIHVCGFSLSIAPSATSADTAQFEYGTSTNCTGTNALTGLYGAGDLTTAAPPLSVNLGNGGQTMFSTPAANGLCIVVAGTTVNVQGFLTYVQL